MNTSASPIENMRNDARTIFQAGLGAVEPGAAIRRFVRCKGDELWIDKRMYDLSRFNHLYVVGAGKAGAPMAAALEEILGARITQGLINVKYDHILPLDCIELIEAGHPLPDPNGQRGSRMIHNILSEAGEKDLVLCLISGGGSALLPLPPPPLSLEDKQLTTDALLSCGARINEINAIRKHMSRLKGGRLAKAAHPATLICLILSDVVGDDLDVIASGPTVPDPSTFQECMDIFIRYQILDGLPKAVSRHFEDGISGIIPETPKPDDPAFEGLQNLLVGNNTQALSAARHKAENLGYHTIVLSSSLEGETRDVARMHAAIAKEVIRTNQPLPSPACILSGGETTVTLKGNGKGGRNQEFALAGAIAIADETDIVVLSAGTDGTDGPTDAAGAFADSQTLARAQARDMDPTLYLENNDAYHFFEPLGDLLITGPTHTNVMDLRIILVDGTKQ
jgi:glycerate 2-kinase